MRLNLPQFEPLLKPLARDFSSHFTEEESPLFPEFGERKSKRIPIFEELPTLFYAILSKEEFSKLQKELNQIPLKIYIQFLQNYFEEYPHLFTEKWGSYTTAVPFLVVAIDNLKFYNLSLRHIPDRDIRLKTGRFAVKDEYFFSFRVEKDGKTWEISISQATSDSFKATYTFEWYETERYFPLVIYNVPLQVPTSLWNIILLLSQDLLKGSEITDGEDVYPIPIIAFEINRPYFLSGKSIFVRKIFSNSFSWRTLQIYYPKDRSNLEELIHQGLAILDAHKISFLPEYQKDLEAIIFSYGIKGIAAGQVSVEYIGGRAHIFIDLGSFTITAEIILHELLHKTSYTVYTTKTIRESFTSLATYLLLPPEELQKFQQKVLSGELRGGGFFGPDLAYTIFPVFLYQTFLQENPLAFISLYTTPTLEELLAKLPTLFTKKLFHEELTYLCDFRNSDKYLEYDYEYLMNDMNANKIVMQLLAIYYFKEELTKNFTYRLVFLNLWRAAFQQKGVPSSEADIEYHELDPYIKKLPPELVHIVQKILITGSHKS
jgi:hypothetical protein